MNRIGKRSAMWMAGMMMAAVVASTATEEAAAQGGLSSSGNKVFAPGGAPTQPRPCDRILRFTEAFERRIDGWVQESVDFELKHAPDLATSELGSGTNPWLDEFTSTLERNAGKVAGEIAAGSLRRLDTYLARVSVRFCEAAVNALKYDPPQGLGLPTEVGKVRYALCRAIDTYYDRVRRRITDTVAQETDRALSSILPRIPAHEVAVLPANERRRLESEIDWFVAILTERIADAVDIELDAFADRVQARACP